MKLYLTCNDEVVDEKKNKYLTIFVEGSEKKLKEYLTSIGKPWTDTLFTSSGSGGLENVVSFNINDKSELMKFINIPIKLDKIVKKDTDTYYMLKKYIFNSEHHDIIYEGMKKHPELFYPSTIIRCEKFSEEELEYLLTNSKVFESKTRVMGGNSTNRSISVNAILKNQDISFSFLKKILERYADDENFQGEIIKVALSKKVLEHQLYTKDDLRNDPETAPLVLRYEVSK